MSITITAVPFMLLAGILSATGAKSVISAAQAEGVNDAPLKAIKEYTTMFMDKDLLTKTLIEHGAQELSFIQNYVICQVGELTLRFEKIGENPYSLTVMCPDENVENCDKTVDEMLGEYTQNVQEATYFKIKERLEKNNLKIAEEEILEDNSIMLTVNIN